MLKCEHELFLLGENVSSKNRVFFLMFHSISVSQGLLLLLSQATTPLIDHNKSCGLPAASGLSEEIAATVVSVSFAGILFVGFCIRIVPDTDFSCKLNSVL